MVAKGMRVEKGERRSDDDKDEQRRCECGVDGWGDDERRGRAGELWGRGSEGGAGRKCPKSVYAMRGKACKACKTARRGEGGALASGVWNVKMCVGAKAEGFVAR
jgi:hypothetical protein